MNKLSIIIPVYNEEKTIKELLDKVKNVQIPLEKEVIVIDDGSTDGSLEAVNSFKGIKLIAHRENKGKGAAVKTALRHSTGDIIIIQDADLEYAPEQIPILIKPILEKECEVIYGSRFLKESNEKWKLPLHYIGNRLLSFLANFLYGCRLTDIETGYKVFTRKVKDCLNLKLDDFGFEVEFTAQVSKKGFRIKELAIDHKPRLRKEGKKITWRDGIKAFFYMFKFCFTRKSLRDNS